jgi:hypothetical protein
LGDFRKENKFTSQKITWQIPTINFFSSSKDKD